MLNLRNKTEDIGEEKEKQNQIKTEREAYHETLKCGGKKQTTEGCGKGDG